MEMGDGLAGPVFGGIDVSGAIVRQDLGPTAGVVMADAAIECLLGIELLAEESDASLDLASAGV